MNTSYREFFKKNVERYETTTRSRYITLIFSLEKKVLDEFFKKIDSKNKKVMDFACGSGRWTQYLEDKFKNVCGLDVSKKMIEYAKRKCKKSEFILVDITSTKDYEKLKGKKFDVITAFRFYKNAESELRQAATIELGKYLKDEGYFIFDLHLNTFSLMGIFACILRLLKINSLFGMGELSVKTISLWDIRKIFKDTGLKIVDYYGMGILPSRGNFLILPQKYLAKIEYFFTRKKMFRNFGYNLLIVSKKK
jgi:SAM-dependent methyltransferase